MMYRPFPAFLAATMLLTAPAFAADIPGSAATRVFLQVSPELTRGEWEHDGDSDWYKVNLRRGEDYAVTFDSSGFEAPATATLRSPKRKPLKSVSYSSEFDAGFEYRATQTNTYFLDATGKWDPDFHPAGRSYLVRVTIDCRDAATTRCKLELGKKRNGLSAWIGDWDRYAINLLKTKRYTFTVDVPSIATGCSTQLLDSNGTKLAEVRYSAGRPAVFEDFKPEAAGKHFLRARCDVADNVGSRYEVLVTAR
jgi:hypothetical protein